MSSQDIVPADPEQAGATGEALERERPIAGKTVLDVSWRSIGTAVLVASGAFLALFVLGNTLPEFFFVNGIVFLPVAIWLGRVSRRPVLDGLFFGLAAAVPAFLIMVLGNSPLGGWGVLYALILAVPQGVFGSWLGARLVRDRGVFRSSGPAEAEPSPSPDLVPGDEAASNEAPPDAVSSDESAPEETSPEGTL
jgi:hypothetical protein